MNAIEIFNSLMEEKIEDSEFIVSDYIEAEDFELHLSFFDNIPLEYKREVLEDFIELIYDYQKYYHKRFENDKDKPHIKIKKDINVIQKYQDMLHRLYGAKNKNTGRYELFNIPKELMDVYKLNKKLLEELEEKQFKIFSKYEYYEFPQANKNKIKEYLKKIRLKYKLNSLYEKQLIDSI